MKENEMTEKKISHGQLKANLTKASNKIAALEDALRSEEAHAKAEIQRLLDDIETKGSVIAGLQVDVEHQREAKLDAKQGREKAERQLVEAIADGQRWRDNWLRCLGYVDRLREESQPNISGPRVREDTSWNGNGNGY